MRTVATMIGVSAALTLGACSTSVFDWETFRTPDTSILMPRSVATMKTPVLKAVTAEDLVDAEGRCSVPVASTTVSPDGSPAPETVALTPGAIALEMTECDVVKRAGQPERVQVGTNERNERTLTLTYVNGERPGIYYFTSGRLSSMERGPEPPKPKAKPRSKAKPKLKPSAT